MGSKSHWVHKTSLESESSTISSDSKLKSHNKEPDVAVKKSVDQNKKLPEWDSHLNMQQLVKNRTKLQTPNSDESIEAYAKACRAKFDRKCAKAKTKEDHSKKVVRSNSRRNQPIYTKPYSSDSYSDIQNMQRSSEGHAKRKQDMITDAYTSVSDGFLSPNSISIGVAANSTSNTTTHQYDTKISVGLQTTNTLERMPIIQFKKPVVSPETITSQHGQPTVRVNKLTVNKQLQVRPESLAYIIMFKEEQNPSEKVDSKLELAQECGNQLYANTSRVNSAKCINSIDSQINNQNNNFTAAQQTTGIDQLPSNSSSAQSLDHFTLQECLQARRPDFYANAEQRRKCLNDLHNLR